MINTRDSRKIYATLALALSLNASSLCQEHAVSTFSGADKIEVQIIDDEVFASHTIEKGQTLYSISKSYNVPLNELYALNRISKGSTQSVGQIIKVPVHASQLYTEENLNKVKGGHFIPIFYQVKVKETLYNIAKVKFEQSISSMMKRNNLKSTSLSTGQKLLIGWLPLNHKVQKPESATPILNTEIDENASNIPNTADQPLTNSSLSGSSLDNSIDSIQNEVEIIPEISMLLHQGKYSSKLQIMNRSEVANWDKSIPDNGMVFALHSDALLDSYIEILNPVLNRSVRAKVIGRIPYGSYTEEVSLVLSPRAAKQLGALDGRFKVNVQYLK